MKEESNIDQEFYKMRNTKEITLEEIGIVLRLLNQRNYYIQCRKEANLDNKIFISAIQNCNDDIKRILNL